MRNGQGQTTVLAVKHRGCTWRAGALAGGGYLVLALLVWWHVWTSHPTSVTVCGCGDPSLLTWFLAWPAFAIQHGLNPLYSTALFHPGGVNLLDNTSEVAFGVVLAPVTWVFGPIVTLNVALTLSPTLSAMAMFVLLRRWVAWEPAAFVGGLFYGFSPFVIANIGPAHLMTGFLAIPPLILLCLDELLVRQKARPVFKGILLGVLLVVQFFIGTELLLIMVLFAAVGVGLVVAYGIARRPTQFRARLRHAVIGLGTAAATCVTLLAYPLLFALDGPAHIAGSIWGGFSVSIYHAYFQSLFVSGAPETAHNASADLFGGYSLYHAIGGYQGSILSDQFFGYGITLVLVVGLVLWHRDRRLWLFATLTVVSVALSLGLSKGTWTPWRVFATLPLFENVIPGRILAVAYLSVAIMLALIVDRARTAVIERRRHALAATEGNPFIRVLAKTPSWIGAGVALLLAAIAIAASARYLAEGLPLTTEPVDVPTWFSTVGLHQAPHQVLLVLPAPFALDTAMTWQAVDGMSYSMVGGAGPGGLLSRAGREQRGQAVISEVSHTTNPYLTISAQNVESARRALSEWGVTKVVLPDQPNLPKYEKVQSPPLAAAIITEATGELPRHEADAWVWNTTEMPAARPRPWMTTLACISSSAHQPSPTVTGTTRCVFVI